MTKNKSGIYKLSWRRGYFYFGQSQDLVKRRVKHLSDFIKGKHGNKAMQNVFNKYGAPDFEVMEFCELDKLNIREQFYIDLNCCDKKLLNICMVAGSVRGVKRSREFRRKISMSKIGKPSYIRTIENRAATSERSRGNRLSETTKLKLKLINTGKKYSAETNKKKGVSRYGSDNPQFGKASILRKAVVKINRFGTVINYYPSLELAASENNLFRSHVRLVCNKKCDSAKGLIFKFYGT